MDFTRYVANVRYLVDGRAHRATLMLNSATLDQALTQTEAWVTERAGIIAACSLIGRTPAVAPTLEDRRPGVIFTCLG